MFSITYNFYADWQSLCQVLACYRLKQLRYKPLKNGTYNGNGNWPLTVAVLPDAAVISFPRCHGVNVLAVLRDPLLV